MGKADRIKLHNQLVELCPNAYYQPPSNVTLTYPCIVYRKSNTDTIRANNKVYGTKDAYQLSVITRDPDSELPEQVLHRFSLINVDAAYTVDNLHHTTLTLYY